MSDPFLIVGGSRRGRPPRAETRSTRRVEFVVTDAEYSALKDVAKSNGARLASVIRDAVNTFVADYGERVVFMPSGDRFPSRTSD